MGLNGKQAMGISSFVDADVDMQEGPMDDSEFAVPEICPEKPEPGLAGRFHKHIGGVARMRSLLPNAHYGALLRYHLMSSWHHESPAEATSCMLI